MYHTFTNMYDTCILHASYVEYDICMVIPYAQCTIIFSYIHVCIYMYIYIYVSYNRVLTKNMSHALSHESLNIDFDPGPRDWVESPLTRIVFHTNYRMDTQWNHGPYVSISSQYSRKKTVFRNLSIATYLVNIPIYSHLPSGNQRWHFWKSMGSSHL